MDRGERGSLGCGSFSMTATGRGVGWEEGREGVRWGGEERRGE